MNPQLFCLVLALSYVQLASGTAYCSYHEYQESDSLTTVSCSDGANGLMTRFGYTTLAPMWPYVTAYSGAGWNSPNCGDCMALSAGGKTIYITVIDQCGPPPGGYDAHFDIAPPAFQELFGDAGVNAGTQPASWSVVASSNCRGNAGNSGGSPPPPPPPPSNPNPPSGNGGGTVRCGSSWTDANSRCANSCGSNLDCGSSGGYCWAALSTSPCGSSPPPPPPPPPPPSNPNPPPSNNGGGPTRCGAGWSDANGRCGTPCPSGTDAECPSGQTCFGQLSTSPCGQAVGDYADNFGDPADYATDYAVATDPTQMSTTTTTDSSSQPAGWMVALIVLSAVVLVLLLAVIIQLALIARRN